jgi:lipoate-protein ligase A
LDQPGPGALVMARDEALLSEVASGPVLRLYGWENWTLSLGRFQKPEKDLLPGFLSNPSFPMVRRMTGGGAILHGQELTYSLVCRQEDLGTKDVKASFELLCQFLILFYKKLGLEAEFAVRTGIPQEQLGQKTAFCFGGKEEYDLLIGGKKMGGNAQRRFKDVIFQHGSIPISLNWKGLGLIFPKEDIPQGEEITSLDRELAVLPDWERLQAFLKDAFEESYSVDLAFHSQDQEYRARADELLAVYGSESWTLKRERE